MSDDVVDLCIPNPRFVCWVVLLHNLTHHPFSSFYPLSLGSAAAYSERTASKEEFQSFITEYKLQREEVGFSCVSCRGFALSGLEALLSFVPAVGSNAFPRPDAQAAERRASAPNEQELVF